MATGGPPPPGLFHGRSHDGDYFNVVGGVLVTRSLDIALPWTLPVSAAHGLLMTFAFMPLYFAGFLFTAGPKWLHLHEVEARSLLSSLAAMLSGWVLVLIGFHTYALLACTGMALVAAGWTALTRKFFGMVARSDVPDRTHARWVAIACCVGAITMWTAAASLGTGSALMMQTTTQVALWAFIASVFAAVSHRMIPFLGTSGISFLDAWRPMWLLWTQVTVLCLEALFNASELWFWPLPTSVRMCQIAIELPACLVFLWLAFRWVLVQSPKIRLIAMLQCGFAWLGVSLALNAWSHTLMVLTSGAQSLGLAPLHAMTMGYLGATMFAMTTRVSSGHGGRPVAADGVAWTLYWILQLAVFLRVIAAVWPSVGTPLTLLAIAAWTAFTSGWAIRYGSWFGRPRPDGRAG